MAYGNASSMMQGGMEGAAAGAPFGPWGAAIGGVAGLAMGGLFGGQKNYGYSKGDLDYIAAQGLGTAQNNYNTYSGLINDYLNQAQNISSSTWANYFGPSTITKMAAMGLDPNSGATNSALAQQSMLMQSGLMNNVFGARQNALSMLNNSQMAIRSGQLSGGMQNFGIPQQNPFMQGFSSLASGLTNYGLQRNLQNNYLDRLSAMNPAPTTAGSGGFDPWSGPYSHYPNKMNLLPALGGNS